MELKDILQQMIQQTMNASQLTDLQVGTVTSTSPLEITISPAMAPLRAGVLYFTSAVVEKKITKNSLIDSVVCYENGTALPSDNDYIFLNTALSAGDRVLLLRVQSGQKFIILSRIFEGVS